ncbi:MAG: hypothetical protein IKZ93_05300, partial [Prevotella sp.]|nr:hypothetical protein [Prevotella sp.]
IFLILFSLAQRKDTKETSTLTRPSPIWEGSTDSGQEPPSIRVLVWLTSLCPFGVSHAFFSAYAVLPHPTFRHPSL